MATLDQLPPEQRAIVELVVQRGRSYETLAEVLQVPSARVRELARDALTELSPRTANMVDVDRRGQVADYLLRQQSPDEERSTRDYLKQSEPARAWALSLLDSLDPLYQNGGSPPVPEPSGAPIAAREPEPESEAETAAAETAEDRLRTRERERAGKRPLRAVEAEEKQEAEKAEAEPERGALSPEAQSALKRRRVVGAVAGLAILAAIVIAVLAIAGAFSSDKKKTSSSSASTTASSTTTPSGSSTTAGQSPVQVVGGIALNPVGKAKARGVAYVVQQSNQRYLVVQAQVPPLPNTQKVAAYEVWLYNSNSDARSLGAQYTNAQGVLQGRAPLPVDVGKFKSIDISRELFADKNAGHGNASVLRGDFSTIKPVQQPGGASTTPGATTTPGP
jgi:DNA-directed RNA polymerase specialized sigma24 family protein